MNGVISTETASWEQFCDSRAETASENIECVIMTLI